MFLLDLFGHIFPQNQRAFYASPGVFERRGVDVPVEPPSRCINGHPVEEPGFTRTQQLVDERSVASPLVGDHDKAGDVAANPVSLVDFGVVAMDEVQRGLVDIHDDAPDVDQGRRQRNGVEYLARVE